MQGDVIMKPVIGLTTFYENKPRRNQTSVSNNYINSVIKAGGLPIMIPIINDDMDINKYIDMFDGIIFTGGEDVSPILYGENPLKQVTYISTDRDTHEIAMFKKAYEKNVPILGICRGIQLMNVALGGTLYQDIDAQIEGALGHGPMENPVNELYHSVNIQKNSILYNIFQTEDLTVNSFHHQSIKDLGTDLRVTALSAEGIIEGVESCQKDFVVGVQWHPEDLTSRYPLFLKLFQKFIVVCGK
jgi:putative glutamine amidotransferase